MIANGALGKILLSIGATLLALGGAECALRGVGYGDAGSSDLTTRDGLPWPRIVERGATVNAMGFRGAAFAEPKRPGGYRIAVVGDSFTFGVGVGDDETLPAHLQRELAAFS